MKEVRYKGYVIKPIPQQLADSDRGNMNLTISKDHRHSVVETQFSAANTFATEEEANEHCINFGKQIIDGKSKTCTVDDL